MPHDPRALPEFTSWPTFPFEGDLRVKPLDEPAEVEPPRQGEDPEECSACRAPDQAYIWVSARWRVRALDRPTGLPMVLILESRSHLDLGDLPNLLAAELGVMTVRLERAIRSIEGVGRVHINRWGDGSAHLHLWFLARPYGRLQLRGTFLSLWDDILPPIPEARWRENLALVAAWLGEFGGRPLAQPPPLDWKAALADAPEVDPLPAEEGKPTAALEPAESEEDAPEPRSEGESPSEGPAEPPAETASEGEPAEPTAGLATEAETAEPETLTGTAETEATPEATEATDQSEAVEQPEPAEGDGRAEAEATPEKKRPRRRAKPAAAATQKTDEKTDEETDEETDEKTAVDVGTAEPGKADAEPEENG